MTSIASAPTAGSRSAASGPARFVQATFDDLGRPLSGVTFVVVDLETTGGRAGTDSITEIGAVKVCGGQRLGEFQTLVNPGQPIPAFISVLTGITDSMVAGSPRIADALPAFLEFARGSVLVAHNARFDITFLKAAAAELGLDWPGFAVVDTVHLARQLVSSDEAPNCKLSSLAVLFGATQTPDHRALHDARATVDVLHALIARVGNLGVHTLEELQSYTSRVTPAQRRKRVLAAGLPNKPGVYVFKDATGRALYVGTSVDIRRRVSSYFTASEQRTRMAEMVSIATQVTPIVCGSALEAGVRELRLIAEHKPPYNRRSKRPEKAAWIKLTAERYPRLSVVRSVRDDGATYAGPFASRASAETAVAALHDVLPLRRCTGALVPGRRNACALAELGKCGAPCTGEQSHGQYAEVAGRAQAALRADPAEIVTALQQRMAKLSDQERFEDAGAVRDRLLTLVRAIARGQRIAPLAEITELVAARRGSTGGWEVVCVRHGRFAGGTLTPARADPTPYIQAMVAAAEVVSPPVAPMPAAHPAETEQIIDWLEQPGVRLVDIDGRWTCPLNGAGRQRELLAARALP